MDSIPNTPPPRSSNVNFMVDLVALCKRRGFVFPSSEIYNGINGFWDFGPLGIMLKNNIRDLWWNDMVICPPLGPNNKVIDIFGLDSSIIQNPNTWKASGHVDGFHDPMVDCRETKHRYRLDHVKVLKPEDSSKLHFAYTDELKDYVLKKAKKLQTTTYKISSLLDYQIQDYPKIVSPQSKKPGTFTEPKIFNLMFKTSVGATTTDKNITYLRPETAQGIFINFKNILNSSRACVPFGIAQIGKAFRNEVTPRNFIYRSREFEQMELEWFCHKDDAKMWFEYWINQRKTWWEELGISKNNLQFREHTTKERAHYAKQGQGVHDIEYRFPFTEPGFGELEGIAHRTNFDLQAHQEHAKTKMDYFDPHTQKSYIPEVIEPASGLTRGVLAILCEAYTKDESRPSKLYMNFKPSLAPIKAAILPLMNKPDLNEMGFKIFTQLRKYFKVDFEIKQSIGKRYARHDEAGTPFCVTIDFDSLIDQNITIRDRNTLNQTRINITKLKEYLIKKIKL